MHIFALKSATFVQILCRFRCGVPSIKMKLKELAICLSFLAAAVSCEPDRFVAFNGYTQGGVYSVKYNTRGVSAGTDEIRTTVDSLLTSIEASLSGYNKGSLLSRLNAGERIAPDGYMLDVYECSRRCWEASGGAFDVAAGPLFDAWGFGFKSGDFPTDEAVAGLLAVSGMARLVPSMREVLDENGTLVSSDLLREGVEGPAPVLNFNAIAQGFTSDAVASYLRSKGVRDYLVDIGEISLAGHNPSGKGWAVGIDAPVDGNMTPGAKIEAVWTSDGGTAGIVTSGNYRKYYIRDGKKYAHTIDPRIGRPVEHNLLSATVAAPDATIADSFATACMALGPDDAKSLILSRDDLEGCLIFAGDSIWTSPGFTIR